MMHRVRKRAAETLRKQKNRLRDSFIGDQKKILFDHLPKCGGTSLCTYLEDNYPKEKSFMIDGSNPEPYLDAFRKLAETHRYAFDLIAGHLANQLLDYVHPNTLKVTVLREPVDRIVSHYFYAKRTPRHYLYPMIHESDIGLEDYVTMDFSGELRNWYTSHFSGLSIAQIAENPAHALESALDVLLNYDIVGFLDDFPAFTKTLCRRARLKNRYQNDKENVTVDRTAIQNVSPSVIHNIEQLNQLDIALYEKLNNSKEDTYMLI